MQIILDVCYDGKGYAGWQVQKNGLSIQQVLNEALTTILRVPIETLGSGRTDAGVHANQQIVQFEYTGNAFDPDRFLASMNSVLPPAIALNAVYQGPEHAHVRFDALSRTYVYRIVNRKNPFENGRAWILHRYNPDLEKLNALSKVLVGTHDFTTFSKMRSDLKNHVCQVMNAHWFFENDALCFRIQANRFLRGMVRALTGSLVHIERNNAPVDQLFIGLESRDRSMAASLAPPEGLYLEKVAYPEDYLKPLNFGG